MIKATFDRVIVRVQYADKLGDGVIVLPDTVKKRYVDFHGEVVSIGPDVKFDISLGDKIMFIRNEGLVINADEKDEYLAVRQEHCLARIRDD